MINRFISFLANNEIPYKFTNGYKELLENTSLNNDNDILLSKSGFSKIDSYIEQFCLEFNYKVVQLYFQDVFAKNIFIYNPRTGAILNLDLYGELSRNGVKLFSEKEIFTHVNKYKSISILQPEQELIQYFIKKIDKGIISMESFRDLVSLYGISEELCNKEITRFFKINGVEIIEIFREKDYDRLVGNIEVYKKEFSSLPKTISSHFFLTFRRILNRLVKPTGLIIAFLGPDGSGKSTIINGLLEKNLPFRRNDYFHLKPILKKNSAENEVITNPHECEPYSKIKSYLKLVFFVWQYNTGWFKNIFLLKRKSSLIIFDRYYDDVLVDYKRYRYGGSKKIAVFLKHFIPRPDLYFVLTADPQIVRARKQEVEFNELQRQVSAYRALCDGKRYYSINVDRTPNEIINEVTTILMRKMNERY